MVDFATRRTMMVDSQVRPSDVTKFPIIDAMLNVPRELFVPPALREAAYSGDHLALGGDRVLLDPRTLAKLLDTLAVTPSEAVLDVGCGLGYSTALLARLADFVVGLDEDAARADEAQALLSEIGCHNAAVLTGPLAEGAAKCGPYDAMLFNGAIEVFPAALAAQLKDGGRVAAIWADGMLGVARLGRKSGDRIDWQDVFNASAPVLPGYRRQRVFAL